MPNRKFNSRPTAYAPSDELSSIVLPSQTALPTVAKKSAAPAITAEDRKKREDSPSSSTDSGPELLFHTPKLTPKLKAEIERQIEGEVKSLAEEDVRKRLTEYQEKSNAGASTHFPLYYIELNQFKAITLLKAYVKHHPNFYVNASLAQHFAMETLKDEGNSCCLPF